MYVTVYQEGFIDTQELAARFVFMQIKNQANFRGSKVNQPLVPSYSSYIMPVVIGSKSDRSHCY